MTGPRPLHNLRAGTLYPDFRSEIYCQRVRGNASPLKLFRGNDRSRADVERSKRVKRGNGVAHAEPRSAAAPR